MDFRSQVTEQLKGLDKRQLCQFAWRCGLRALPFLGGSCPSPVKMLLKTPAKLQNIDNKANNNIMHGYRL